jgi:hypothetical protein
MNGDKETNIEKIKQAGTMTERAYNGSFGR